MTGMTVICETCNQPIEFNHKARHRRDCLPGEPSTIAVIPPETGGADSEALPKDKHGRVTVGDKKVHPQCSICENDVFKAQLKSHQAECYAGNSSEIGIVKEDTNPLCAYCEGRIERGKYREHSRRCAVSQSGSEYGTPSGSADSSAGK